MKRNPEESSPAHEKILRLLESLQQKSPQEEDPMLRKVEGFKQTILSHQQIFKDKFISISASLSEMQKDANPTGNYSQLRMMNAYNQNISDIESSARESCAKQANKLEREEKSLNNQILSHKVRLAHQEEEFRSQIFSAEKDFHEMVNETRAQLKGKEGPNYKEINLKSQIHGLNRQIVQLSHSELKSDDLKESERKIERLINEEEEQLNKNFRMHCDTLQKLMKSISERLQ